MGSSPATERHFDIVYINITFVNIAVIVLVRELPRDETASDTVYVNVAFFNVVVITRDRWRLYQGHLGQHRGDRVSARHREHHVSNIVIAYMRELPSDGTAFRNRLHQRHLRQHRVDRVRSGALGRQNSISISSIST